MDAQTFSRVSSLPARCFLDSFPAKLSDWLRLLDDWRWLGNCRWLLSAQARDHSLTLFTIFRSFSENMRLKRKFEGESFFNMSSVRHVKHVTVKSNSRWKKNSPFHISYGDFTVDKALLVHMGQYGDFLATKMWQRKRWFIFHCSEEYHRSYSTSTERNMSTVVSKTYYSFL